MRRLVGMTAADQAAVFAEHWESELSRFPTGTAAAPARTPRTPRYSSRDALDDVTPREYVEALTGVEVPRHGMILCPLHEERTPSFKVYESADRGWHCFGCGRGGTIYDFAAALWGSDTRGTAFLELRQELARALVSGAA